MPGISDTSEGEVPGSMPGTSAASEEEELGSMPEVNVATEESGGPRFHTRDLHSATTEEEGEGPGSIPGIFNLQKSAVEKKEK
jgi:hypothetical protein